MPDVHWGIIGFGEAGANFCRHLNNRGSGPIFITDPLLNQAPAPDHIRRRLDGLVVEKVPDIPTLVARCDVVLSLVTPGAASAVAANAATSGPHGLFIDFNSASPTVKRKLEKLFPEDRYVDGSILGSVSTDVSGTALALAGRRAEQAQARLHAVDLKAEVVGPDVGAASALKICRSIFMKGIECLFIETLLATEEFKITDYVVRSIQQTLDASSVEQLIAMLVTTHSVHCHRRSQEMEGAASMLKKMEIPNRMCRAARDVLKASYEAGLSDHFAGSPPGDPREVIGYLRTVYGKHYEAAGE